MSTKQRLSASVDPELIAAGQAAVSAGRAVSLSAWVTQALSRQVDHDRRLAAMDELLADFEAEHGAFTEAEIDEAVRAARERSTVVRGARTGPSA